MDFSALLNILYSNLLSIWSGFISFIPNLIAAIVVFIIGVIIASGLGALAEKIIAALKVDMALERMGLREYFDRAGFNMDSGWFVGRLVYWLILLAFILAVASILKLNDLNRFLGRILEYMPNLIVAALVMIAAILIGNVLARLIKGFFMAGELGGSGFASTLVRWAVLVFGLWGALVQLKVDAVLPFNILMIGFIAMIAIAGGLAFGLGGRDYAAHLLDRLRKQMEGRHEE